MKYIIYLIILLPFVCKGQDPPGGTYSTGNFRYIKNNTTQYNPLWNIVIPPPNLAITKYCEEATVKYEATYIRLRSGFRAGTFTTGYFRTIKSIEHTLIVKDVTCYGGTDGSAEITVTSGAPPYSFLWNTGQTSNKLTNVKSQQYNCVITDSEGTQKTVNVYIGEPTEITVEYSVGLRACSLNDFGTLYLYISGGTSPYTSNDPVHFVGSIYTNKPGDYNLIITDNVGCKKTATFSVTNYQISSVTLTETNNSGFFYLSKVLMNDNTSFNLQDQFWVSSKNSWEKVSSWNIQDLKYTDCADNLRDEDPGTIIYLQSLNEYCAKRELITSLTISDPISSCNPYTGKPLIASTKNEPIISTTHNKVHVYPNPSSGQFTISYSLLQDNIEFRLYDLYGHEVYNTKLVSGLAQSKEVECNNSPGIYVYKILTEDGLLLTDKLVIQ